MRPITVLLRFWRVWLGAWLAKPDMHRWTRQVLHPDVAYGQGMDAQVSAGVVLQAFPTHRYMASLDYHKCFDLLRIQPTCQLFEQSGFHPPMCKLLP